MNSLGRHILVEFTNCTAEKINDVLHVEKSMIEAAEIAKASVINSTFHHFSPWGISGVIVIEESHFAIHTWPEYKYASVDLFTCGQNINPWDAFEHLKTAFQSMTYSAIEINRGSLHLLSQNGISKFEKNENTVKNLDLLKKSRHVWFTDKDEQQALSLRYNKVLFNEVTPFQKVRVFDTEAFGKMLAINDMVMCTERDEFHYHEMIVHPVMQIFSNIEKVLVIGGGDGGTVRELLRYPQVKKIDLVEIDEAVIRASTLHLPTLSCQFKNERLNVIVGDGIEHVKRKDLTYDLIIVDGSDPVGPAEGLFTKEFYQNCFHLLTANGALVSQGESPLFHKKIFADLFKCLSQVFGTGMVHTLLFFASSYPTGMWSFQLTSKKSFHPVNDFNRSAADNFVKKNDLQYYNSDIHMGSFALPNFVKKMIQ